ncbi:MlaD family protein [Sulfurimonas microaerophilic]|uniref:MlaD family protein n=1 Tax=Sulfurimonas microaerophilic TaxID=3058392 RepID=UPI002714746A|nr:MlaD family protein [Sulfurimonas sp. hsl 1-7]
MNNKVNYTLIGTIVLLGFFTLASFSYWMLKPSHEDEIKRYVIYFDESVFGLNLDAPVKFRGINVGKVSNLRINPHNSEQVEVQVTILKDTPIKDNIVAVLTAQGITGLTYVNLTIGETYTRKIVEIDGDDYHVIATAPSIFQNLQKSWGSVSEHMTDTLFQAEKLLKDENQEKFMKLVTSTTRTFDKIGDALDEKTIANFQSAVKNLDIAIQKIEGLVDHTVKWEDNVSKSLYSIKTSYNKIDGTMTEFKKALASGEFNFKEISSEVLPNMNNALLQLQETMMQLDNSLKRYDRSPSDLIFKHEEIKKAPGER